jgi:peptidoglycan-associated lipoprotein
MRTKAFIQTLLITLTITFITTGCGANKPKWWPFGTKSTTAGGPGPIGGSDVGGMGERPAITGDMIRGQYAPVYFDYDSSRIRPSEHRKLEQVAAALKGSNQNLIIEGHTDERGTAEYNRALGERRAQAAREALTSLGIAGTRITTISFGKDRPAEIGHDDTAWSRNRRCEFVVVGQ